jgi:hypothetical protein
LQIRTNSPTEFFPENTAPLEYGIFDKLDLDSEELEIVIENTKESLEAAQATLKSN